MAGLFYAWSCSVIPGLHRLPNDQYLVAMRSINRAILNPMFFVGFIGAALLLPVCAWRCVVVNGIAGSSFVLVALVIYWVGTMGVTTLGNVPLNNMLDAQQLDGITTDTAVRVRSAFETAWVRLHTIRTIAAVITLVLLLSACIRTNSAPTN
jgi:uncharacterized membrane protein